MTTPPAQADERREIRIGWFTPTLGKHLHLYVELVILAICVRLVTLVEPFIFQVVIDRILPFQREASLTVVAIVFLAAAAFQILFEVLATILGTLAAMRILKELAHKLYHHLFSLPFAFFRKWQVGETIARTQEINTIQNFLLDSTTSLFLDVLFIFIYIFVLFSLSPTLTMVILLALPVQIAIYAIFGPLLRRRLRVQFDMSARHQSRLVESLSGIAAFKALGAERHLTAELDRTLAHKLAAAFRVQMLSLANGKMLVGIEKLITILIIYLGAGLVFEGEMTLGELVAFHLLAARVTGPIENFSAFWEAWQNLRVSRLRLGDIVNQDTEPFDQNPALPAGITPSLHFDDVHFAYGDGAPVLDGFSLAVAPGSFALITGPSGSGKSTFGRLAAGLEKPTAGTIRLGGHDIADFDPHDVRKHVAYVPQESYLFSGTLRDNLVISNPDASDAALWEALERADAGFVRHLAGGLDTPVEEGGKSLSGGQRQRLTLARAFVANPNVLILDEPTSALDDVARRNVIAGLNAMAGDTTIIVITHAPDTFDRADAVITFGDAA
ncbi:peptidase domain-containing ABC transporter [Tateyamaria omphalii]|uniref:ABC transporter n=1 Tax=Tateyamaria omphalii TaxID=299262 RepID=A0A1P8MTI8_9RHOB|nr:peptidase domain-containing ABC transporter [Tateyamaria omphalii]APX11354.1 ABC transporter [Tateyamaria omphalii]